MWAAVFVYPTLAVDKNIRKFLPTNATFREANASNYAQSGEGQNVAKFMLKGIEFRVLICQTGADVV